MKDKKLSKVQVEVLGEYLDLLSNGYVNRFSYFSEEFWLIKVIHLTNNRELTLKWSNQWAGIKENNTTIKEIV